MHSQVRISSVVIDSVTLRPVSYASIGIPGTSRGTAANEAGVFDLIVCDNCQVKISAIGYRSKTVMDNESFPDTLLLVSSDVFLDEFTVSSENIDAKAVVRKAFAKIKENYIRAPFKMKAFYRYTQKVDDQYVRFSEVAFDILKTKGYRNAPFRNQQNNRYRINEVRRSLDFSNNEITSDNYFSTVLNNDIIAFQIDQEVDHYLVDFKLSGKSSLLSGIENYQFDLSRILYNDDEKIYKISISRQTPASGNYEGFIYIVAESLAIVQFEAKLIPTYQHNYNYRRRVLVKYRKTAQGYTLFFVKSNLDVFAKNDNAFIKESRSGEILINDVVLGNDQTITKKIITDRDLFSGKYNRKFWESYTVLKSNPTELAVIRDLSRKKNLEAQFVEKQLYDLEAAQEAKNAEKFYRQFLIDHKKDKLCLVYWASWSDSSREHLKNMQSAIPDYQRQGIRFLFVSVDNIPKNMKKSASEFNLPHENSVRVGRFSDIFDRSFRLGLVPTYRLYHKGKLFYHGDAPPGSEEFDQQVRRLLKKAN
ncbi:MAG: carboxypeptidase-like regulatory domain-containing protein [Bacteroidota bacterium]